MTQRSERFVVQKQWLDMPVIHEFTGQEGIYEAGRLLTAYLNTLMGKCARDGMEDVSVFIVAEGFVKEDSDAEG